MRAALIFPPQWDPRQPPLAPAVLGGALQAAGADVRIFDLNLALYRRLLRSPVPGGIEDVLTGRLLDPGALRDARGYLKTSEALQKIFDERFDPHGKGRLFWDTCGGLPSPAASRNWQAVLAAPDALPFLRHLETEMAELLEWAPDLVGISVISDTQLSAALALAARVRRALPKIRIVLGGDALTYRRSLLPMLSWLRPTIDAICLGDGEPLMTALADGAPIAGSPNSLSWNVSGKSIAGNSILCNLSTSILPDFSDLPLRGYLTPHLVMPVETARGCPWGRCAFCIHPVRAVTGRPLYRPKPIMRVAAEIERLFAAGHRRFFMIDEALPPPRLRELADLFGALPEPVSWIGYARLDAGHTRDGFIRARAAGCRKLFIGVETGSDSLLTRFHKGVDAARARRVLHDAAAAGLAVHFFLMTGFPGEEESDRQATLDLLADVWPAFDPFGVSFDLFPLTGELETALTADPAAFGWKGPSHDAWNDLAWQFPLTAGPATAESLSEFRGRINVLADQIFGTEFGLRHATLAQDSIHLLLLEARSCPDSGARHPIRACRP
ncbi:MAG TPA: radical SAM protein [Candidatus Ozemobacteraceae bacterium]|nr:radical SAM protein [Candidatus Ozemobacteraceae bacterium]